MKAHSLFCAGDLVYHRDDVRDSDCGPIPGLVVGVKHIGPNPEAQVHFTDRTFGEYHIFTDLVGVEDYENGEVDTC